MNSKITAAIANKNLIEAYYKGRHRTLEPHSYGISHAGKESLLAYQVEGDSNSGEMPGWKFLDLRIAKEIQILNRHFKQRPDYHSADKRMDKIIKEL